MKLHYTHHPIFQASNRLSILSGKFRTDKVVQRMRSMGKIELYKMFEDINIFADKLESFLDCESTCPPAGTTRAKIKADYVIGFLANANVLIAVSIDQILPKYKIEI